MAIYHSMDTPKKKKTITTIPQGDELGPTTLRSLLPSKVFGRSRPIVMWAGGPSIIFFRDMRLGRGQSQNFSKCHLARWRDFRDSHGINKQFFENRKHKTQSIGVCTYVHTYHIMSGYSPDNVLLGGGGGRHWMLFFFFFFFIPTNVKTVFYKLNYYIKREKKERKKERKKSGHLPKSFRSSLRSWYP